MDELLVKVGRDRLKISKDNFLLLLNASPVKAYAAYTNAIDSGEISFIDLKDLASRADVPYPLFFAPSAHVKKQLTDRDKNLFEKLPSKNEMRLVGRGSFSVEDVQLIVRDIGRKQEFLKKRILLTEPDNPFIGYIAKKLKGSHGDRELADDIRNYLEIDLPTLRTKTKAGVVDYIRERAERKNILISFSSYNFMPQNLDPDLGLSGLCIKDKKFPTVFVNTRDGDESPKILESDGRQVFTLTAMLVCIAMNRFVFSTKTPKRGDSLVRRVFQIVGEILIPREDLEEIEITNIEELKQESAAFKVTPSMLLARFQSCRLIDAKLAKSLRQELMDELNAMPATRKQQPLQSTGYAKYNGVKFSREVVQAFKKKKISRDDMKNILFRKGKMNSDLFEEYSEKFN
jgi:hypothetical protein